MTKKGHKPKAAKLVVNPKFPPTTKYYRKIMKRIDRTRGRIL